MSNLTSHSYEEIHDVPLVVVAFVSGGDTISTVEAEVLPSVEEIIPCSPNAKPNL